MAEFVAVSRSNFDTEVLPLLYTFAESSDKELPEIGITDLNNAPDGMYYFLYDCTNSPSQICGIVATYTRTSNYKVQFVYGVSDKGCYVRNRINGTWSAWDELVRKSFYSIEWAAPTKISTDHYCYLDLRKSGNVVTLSGYFDLNTHTISQGVDFAIVPEGFRPSYTADVVGFEYNNTGDGIARLVQVKSDGKMMLKNGSATTKQFIRINGTWIV